jgi:transposase
MQQDIQAVHRVRTELVSQRTAQGNQIWGLVAKDGLVAQRQLGHLRRAIPRWLEDAQSGLSMRLRRLLDGLRGDLAVLEHRIGELDAEIEAISNSDPVVKRLQQLRGVGPLTATALVATVSNGEQFTKGRHLAVSLGLVPKQHGTGGKERLLGIRKRGDPYLRKLLVHGARAALYAARDKDDPLIQWAKNIAARSHPNVAAVAWANTTARIAWAMIRHGNDYQPERATT